MRVLLADSTPSVRTALRLVIEQCEGVQIVCECPSAACLLAQTGSSRPDVALVDFDLPGLQQPPRTALSSLTELIHTLRLLAPKLFIIILSSQPTAETTCLQAQADAFVCKSDPPDALIELLAQKLRPVTD